MAYLRTSSDGVGETYLKVLVDGLTGSSYSNITIYNDTTGQYYYASYEGAGRSTVQTFTGLSPGTSYSFSATATPTGSTPKPVDGGIFTTAGVSDNPPTISITNITGENAITVSWSASDDHGLRVNDTFALYISGADNSTLGFKTYTTANSYTFQSDGTGNPLVVGSAYLVRVVVVDNSGKTSYAQAYKTYTKTRPQNFSWTNSKSSGSHYNLTYSEWNSFLDKINEFREFKGFTPLTFSRSLSSGAMSNYIVPKASSFNAAINAINSMNPSISPPSSVYFGQTITANHFNKLRDSLNSIN